MLTRRAAKLKLTRILNALPSIIRFAEYLPNGMIIRPARSHSSVLGVGRAFGRAMGALLTGPDAMPKRYQRSTMWKGRVNKTTETETSRDNTKPKRAVTQRTVDAKCFEITTPDSACFPRFVHCAWGKLQAPGAVQPCGFDAMGYQLGRIIHLGARRVVL